MCIAAVGTAAQVLLREQASWVQRMQKALLQMNIQLVEVLTDVMASPPGHHPRYREPGSAPGGFGTTSQLPCQGSVDEVERALTALAR